MHFRTSWKQRGFRGLGATLGGSQARRLIQASDLTYLGAFKLPEDGTAQACKTFSYGGCDFSAPGGIGFNPAGNGGLGSLYIGGANGGAISSCGQGGPPLVAEVSIPTPRVLATADATQLNVASYLQTPTFADLTGGLATLANLTNDTGTPKVYLGSMLFQAGICYWTAYHYYETGTPYSSHGYSTAPGTLSTPGAHGTYALTDPGWGAFNGGLRSACGYICDIPSDFQASFSGNTHFSGACGLPAPEEGGLYGPGMIAFKAADMIGLANIVPGTPPTVQNVAAKSYLWYPQAHPCPIYDNVGFTTNIAGCAFVSSSSVYGLLYLGQHFKTLAWYGFPTYYSWRNAVGSAFPANQDHPPLHAGMTDYATYGSATGWPTDDVGSFGTPPYHRYWYDPMNSPETGTITGSKGAQQDAIQCAWYIYDPNTVAAHVNGGGATYDLSPDSQTLFDNTTTNNPWLTSNTNNGMLGLAYDRTNRKIYTLQSQAYIPDSINPYPVIHVYQHP